VLFGLLIAAPAVAFGQTITATWDASPPADQVTSYQVCIGTSSRSCSIRLASVGANQTSYTFSPAGGVLHYVAVRAVNAKGAGAYSSDVTFSIPGFTQPVNRSTAINTAITPFVPSVVDPDGSTLSFSHTGLPIGLSLNSTTGRISGTPAVAGTHTVTIFVTDGLVTVSRSFVWTVTTGPSTDTTAPSLTVTSHTNGQSVTSSNVTISGTATDSGSGGSGVSTVRVNGQTATGGTASGNGTASWSRTISLTTGTNTITVEAYDGAGNVHMRQLTLVLSTGGVSTSTGTSSGTFVTTLPVAVGTVTPSAGSGSAQTFSAKYAAARGVADLAWVYLRFSTMPTGAANVCMVRYAPATGLMSLRDNQGVWQPGRRFAQGGSQQNSQCAVSFASSSATASGQTLTLNVAVTFYGSYAGAKNVYAYAQTVGGAITDWQLRGAWFVSTGTTPPPPVAPVSSPVVAGPVSVGLVTPNSGSGRTRTFSAQYSASQSASNLSFVYLKVAARPDGPTNTCMVRYERATGLLSLRNNEGAWQTGRRFWQGGTQSNSQCSIAFSSSSATTSGNTLTLNVAVTFTSAYVGTQRLYGYAETSGGLATGWQQRGSWLVP
jgi:hypothetical protein